jgi:putative heme-binding domain-containing protein
MDKFLDYGLWLTAREQETAWLPAVCEGKFDFDGHRSQLLFALEAVDSPLAVGPLVKLLKEGKVPADHEAKVLAPVAARAGAAEMKIVLELALAEKVPPTRRARFLEALEEAAQKRGIRPEGDVSKLSLVIESPEENVQLAAMRLAGLWHVESLRPRLADAAGSPRSSDAIRRAGLDGLASLGGDASRQALEKLVAPGHPLALRRQALATLARVDFQSAARMGAELLSGLAADSDPADIVGALMGRKDGDSALAKTLGDKHINPDVAKLALRTVTASGVKNSPLVDALTKAGGLSNPVRILTAEQMKALVADVQKRANPARGEKLFRRADLTCLKCHAIAGAGGQVGPDLGSIGASAQIDYLVESLLLPNKAIKENYNSIIVGTNDDRIITGIKVRQTSRELVLRTAEDKEVAVPTASIAQTSPGGSLMPEGLVDGLTRSELIDLVGFLSELGKVGPYSVSKARLVRRWEVAAPPKSKLLAVGAARELAIGDPAWQWSPAYSTVAGVLPLGDVPAFELGSNTGTLGLVRFQLEVETGGKVRLAANGTAGLTAWLDGKLITPDLEMDLRGGSHTVVLAIERKKWPRELRCELVDIPGSPATVRAVGGK